MIYNSLAQRRTVTPPPGSAAPLHSAGFARGSSYTSLMAHSNFRTVGTSFGLQAERAHFVQSPEGDLHFCIDPCDYEEYIHRPTGERRLVRTVVDPQTGARVEISAPPPGFERSSALPAASLQPARSGSFLGGLCRCLGGTSEFEHQLASTTPAAPRARGRASPDDVSARLTFDEDEHEEGQRVAMQKLSNAELKNLATDLELVDIPAFRADLECAIGGTDPDAFELLASDDWRQLLASSPARYTPANLRIARVLKAVLNPNAKNVKLLMTDLREQNVDRPGILTSGMDQLEAIDKLILDRSLGQVKLDAASHELTVLKAGATVTETRIIIDQIKKQFILKPEAERAQPNALLHAILDKMPTDGKLEEKHETYTSDLFKAEMTKAPAPWTVQQLTNNIAVDLARAAKKEVSAADRNDRSKIQCASCGDFGHWSSECKKKCDICKINLCPGVRGMLCVVVTADKPPQDVENALGKVMRPDLQSVLLTAWKAKHPDAKEASSIELPPTRRIAGAIGPIDDASGPSDSELASDDE